MLKCVTTRLNKDVYRPPATKIRNPLTLQRFASSAWRQCRQKACGVCTYKDVLRPPSVPKDDGIKRCGSNSGTMKTNFKHFFHSQKIQVHINYWKSGNYIHWQRNKRTGNSVMPRMLVCMKRTINASFVSYLAIWPLYQYKPSRIHLSQPWHPVNGLTGRITTQVRVLHITDDTRNETQTLATLKPSLDKVINLETVCFKK